MSIVLFFRSNEENNRHHLQLLLAAPNLTSPSLLVRDQAAHFQYAYHRRIKNHSNIRFFAGGLVEINGSHLKYSEGNNSYSYSYPFTTLESNASLSPSVLFEVPLASSAFTVQAWTAIVGYNFGGFNNARGWMWAGDFSNTGTRVSYSKHFSSHWEGRLDYQFQYYTSTKFETISSVVHQINLLLVLKLR